MRNYTTFIISNDGSPNKKQEFEAEDDGKAVRRALSLVDGHSVELWGPQGLIAKFKHPRREWPQDRR